MSSKIFSWNDLFDFSKALFRTLGLEEEGAKIVSHILLEANFRGIDSHGIARIPIYAKRLNKGLINPHPELKVIKETSATTKIDADNGMGHIAGEKAIHSCIEKAKSVGVGLASVTHSNHFGINAYYAMKASQAGYIGVAMTNTSPLMAPFGGKDRVLGSNPMAIAIPNQEYPDVVLDMATTNVARGKLEQALQKGDNIPEGWAIDKDGKVTVDPEKGLKGALMPVGGPKGYGLSLIVDVFSGVLSGAEFGQNVGSLFGDLEHPQKLGHFFAVVDIEVFMNRYTFLDRMAQLSKNIKGSAKAEGFSEIYLPGEIEANKYKKNVEKGVEINESVINELNELSDKLGMNLKF